MSTLNSKAPKRYGFSWARLKPQRPEKLMVPPSISYVTLSMADDGDILGFSPQKQIEVAA
ncbi:hypothetical protein GBA52_012168 [Prunus armeniaca]|nr:hypothetical protein GBA52_012168 [Prunus armeniaca]